MWHIEWISIYIRVYIYMYIYSLFLLLMLLNEQAVEGGRQNRQAQEKSRPSRLSDCATLLLPSMPLPLPPPREMAYIFIFNFSFHFVSVRCTLPIPIYTCFVEHSSLLHCTFILNLKALDVVVVVFHLETYLNLLLLLLFGIWYLHTWITCFVFKRLRRWRHQL